MAYPILSIYEFGEQLLLTKDIDPVYVALEHSGWDKVTKARWCLAYWCLYNAGVASYIAEANSVDGFWSRLWQAAENLAPSPAGGRWPRGKERRHWRGKQALASLHDLQKRYSREPEMFVATVGAYPAGLINIGTMGMISDDPISFQQIASRVKEHTGFGPWMAFKIADMLEQVFHVPVSFDKAAVFMFKDPQEAALRFWRRTQRLPETAKPRELESCLNHVVNHLIEHFCTFEAPNGKRRVGLQEIETILCKWKSHENGHYPVLNDLHEFKDGLLPWAYHSKLARDLLEMRGLGGTL